MALPVRQSTKFKRDIKRLRRQGIELSKLTAVVMTLSDQKPLQSQYHDHALVGNWKGYRECHIQSDWLLIYRIENDELLLARSGTHANLFG
jgi:mRNA interferase YafQ